jgi:hypothetical protein
MRRSIISGIDSDWSTPGTEQGFGQTFCLGQLAAHAPQPIEWANCRLRFPDALFCDRTHRSAKTRPKPSQILHSGSLGQQPRNGDLGWYAPSGTTAKSTLARGSGNGLTPTAVEKAGMRSRAAGLRKQGWRARAGFHWRLPFRRSREVASRQACELRAGGFGGHLWPKNLQPPSFRSIFSGLIGRGLIALEKEKVLPDCHV